jgi:hypothetical protein
MPIQIGVSAALLGTVIEMLARTYSLLDFVHIWFSDGTDETGLRLSLHSHRIANELVEHPPPTIAYLEMNLRNEWEAMRVGKW